MTVKRYLKLCQQMDIGRGQLATHFRAFDSSNVSSLHQKHEDESVSSVPYKPPLDKEDWSHLNSKHWLKVRKAGKHKKPANTRKVKAEVVNTCLAMVKYKEPQWIFQTL